MERIQTDEEGTIEEPCLSCDFAMVDNLFYEWYCEKNKCIHETGQKDKRIGESD